jgi:hypothetical protein
MDNASDIGISNDNSYKVFRPRHATHILGHWPGPLVQLQGQLDPK